MTVECVDVPTGFSVLHQLIFFKPQVAGPEDVSFYSDVLLQSELWRQAGFDILSLGGNALRHLTTGVV